MHREYGGRRPAPPAEGRGGTAPRSGSSREDQGSRTARPGKPPDPVARHGYHRRVRAPRPAVPPYRRGRSADWGEDRQISLLPGVLDGWEPPSRAVPVTRQPGGDPPPRARKA